MAKFARAPVVLTDWKGLKNVVGPEDLEAADLQAAVNVDLTRVGMLNTRAGQTLRTAGSYHSLWAKDDLCLIASGTALKRVRATAATTYAMSTLRSDLTSGARLSYWMVNGQAYYVNGHETGVVTQGVNRTFGLTPPIAQPVATAIGGALPAGRYQYALTFLRNDGQESGTGLAAAIDLTGPGGVGFSSIPVSADPTVTQKALYLTATNGEVLYRAMVIPNADTTANYRNAGYDLRLQLNTQFGQQPPAGHLVAWFKGKMLVAQGNVIWPSVSNRYELFRLKDDFLPFEGEINLLAPVEDGIFVGADKTYFVSGLWTGVPALRVVAEYPAIPGTLAYEQGDYLGDGVAGRVAYWSSPRGHCSGSSGGGFRTLTESRYSFPNAQRGAGLVRQAEGDNHFLAVLEGTGVANSKAVNPLD